MKLRLISFLLILCAAAIHAAPPNVVLIVSDDQGWPDLGCIGAKPLITPNLDRLAAEGVRATSFYVTWPACTPSRGSILTGRYPQRNGLYDMIRNDMVNYGHRYDREEYAVSPEMTLGLDVREKTIGDMLRAAGCATGIVGKWDMGQARRFLPLQRGFDFFYGHGNNGIDYYTHERYGVPSLFRGNERTEEDKGTYVTDVFRREALRFVEEHVGRTPFFLYLPFNAPHGASSFGEGTTTGEKKVAEGVQAPEKYVAMYRGKVKDERLARYCGALTCMDEAIGALLKRLDETKTAGNTLVMFLSDNGGSGNGGNAPLRGAKSSMWEGGLRVPFIARWPGKLPAGRVTDEFLTSLELVPTILAATSAKAPDGVKLDGFDMLPVLRGDVKSPRQQMFWQRRGDKAARFENWKWVDAPAGKNKGGGLFDLATDAGEVHDLSKEKPDVLKMMRGKFAAWRREMDEAEPRGPFRDY
ncbi:MAG: sulfatase-like hydrolase/transferase [Verrucomicrobiaceae bacterium]|nr:sulfatase-like hydrolase/transferase [Verrucomicrobiaceae bacterium]